MAHRMGTPYLQKLLQKTLRSHIKQYLPEVRTDLSHKLYNLEKELKDFEVIVGNGPNARQLYMAR